MSNCKYETSNGRCGLKGSYAYRHKCYGEDMCRCNEPKTNADHIRSMTDEELAKWLEEVDCWNCECCLYMRECRLEYDEAKHDCTTGRMGWLKQPHEDASE